MPRILITSDWHVDARTAGHPREAELVEFVDRLADYCRGNAVDYVVNMGDVFDPLGVQDLRFAALVITLARRLNDAVARGSVWIAGNHDVVHHDAGFTTLSPLAAAGLPGIVVAERPALVAEPDVAFLCLPHPCTPRVADYRGEVADALDAARECPLPVVSVSHLSVAGARMGGESKELARGRDESIPAERIAALPNLVAAFNGHYHQPQEITVRGLRIHVPGSPLRLTFSEAGDPHKGFIVLDL